MSVSIDERLLPRDFDVRFRSWSEVFDYIYNPPTFVLYDEALTIARPKLIANQPFSLVDIGPFRTIYVEVWED